MSLDRSYFLDYQWAWIDDNRRAKICEKSRRIGWTYCSSYRRYRRSLELANHDSWWMTRDLITAKEFIRYVKKWCDLGKIVAKGLEGDHVEVVDPDRGISSQVVQFNNGSRIYVLSSNPDAAAGKGGDLGLDEFALHKDQRLLYQVAKPVIMWGFQLEIISTHRGKGTTFNQLVGQARENPKQWSLHSVNFIQAVEAGLVDKINAAAAARGVAPMTAEEFIAQERAGCIDEDMWNQEYMCKPVDDNTCLLTFELIGAAEAPWEALRDTEEVMTILGPAGERYVGWDIGRQHDLSVIWAIEVLGDMAYTREVVELDRVPFAAQMDELVRVCRRHRPRRVCIDNNGIGMPLAEEAPQAITTPTVVEPVTFGLGTKAEMAMLMLRKFQDRLIRIPEDLAIRKDLHRIRKRITAAGNTVYVAERDDEGHADRFWALALALLAAEHSTDGLTDGEPVGQSEGRGATGSRGDRRRPDHSDDYRPRETYAY